MNRSGGRGTRAAHFESINSLLKFTITSWFKTDSTAKLGGNAVLYANRSGVAGVSVHGDPNTPGNLVLAVDNGSNTSPGVGSTRQWVDFAVTYDGTILQTGPNVFFHAGGINTPLTLVGSGTNTNGSGNDPASNETMSLSLGWRVLFDATDPIRSMACSTTFDCGAKSCRSPRLKASDKAMRACPNPPQPFWRSWPQWVCALSDDVWAKTAIVSRKDRTRKS